MPRVIKPGARVVAEAEPVGGAGGDRDHVLERAAELDADHVVGAVDAEAIAGEQRLHARARSARCCSRRRPRSACRARLPWRSSGRRARASRGCDAPGRARRSSTCVISIKLSFSMPLVAVTISAPAGSERRDLRAPARAGRARARRTAPRRRPSSASREIARDAQRRRQLDARQVARRSRACARCCSASSGVRAHSCVATPLFARCLASAVPQEPAPSTATRVIRASA